MKLLPSLFVLSGVGLVAYALWPSTAAAKTAGPAGSKTQLPPLASIAEVENALSKHIGGKWLVLGGEQIAAGGVDPKALADAHMPDADHVLLVSQTAGPLYAPIFHVGATSTAGAWDPYLGKTLQNLYWGF